MRSQSAEWHSAHAADRVVKFGYLGHARGQRQIVRWKLEQRIIGHRDLMIEDPAVAPTEAEGLGIRDEMDSCPSADNSMPSSVATTPEPP